MFVIFSGLGVPYAATRFISTYMGSGEKEKALNLYPLIFAVSVVFSAIFSVILFEISVPLSNVLFHDPAASELIQLSSVDVFVYSLLTTSIFLLSASMEFRKVAIISIFNSILKYTISFGFFAAGAGLYGIILGLVVGDAITLIMFMYVLAPKIFRGRLSFSASMPELRPLLK